ncbi:MAG: flagellar motor protein MotB [bacterium]|nr:flagellar motor protein MotB [bacterium]
MSGPESQRDEAPVIRIIKKSGHGGGHHGGAWKVAYADFVTAMMALFIVLWILGQDEETQKGIANYFRDPTGKSLILSGSGAISSSSNTMSLRNEHGVDPSVLDLNGDPLRVLEEEADNLKMMIQQEPELQKLAEQISIEVTPEGVRVEINESQRQALFETGSARLSPELTEALKAFGEQFGKTGNPIIIEGHTDSAPYAPSSSMTNWELSTYRANEARKVMEIAGLPETQIFMVRGLADRKPRFNNPADPRNRRISVLMLSAEGLRIAKGSTYAPRDTTVPGHDQAETEP